MTCFENYSINKLSLSPSSRRESSVDSPSRKTQFHFFQGRHVIVPHHQPLPHHQSLPHHHAMSPQQYIYQIEENLISKLFEPISSDEDLSMKIYWTLKKEEGRNKRVPFLKDSLGAHFDPIIPREFGQARASQAIPTSSKRGQVDHKRQPSPP